MTTAIPLLNLNPLTPVTPPPDRMVFPKPCIVPTPHLKQRPDDLNPNLADPTSKTATHPLAPEGLPVGPMPPLDPRYIAMVSRVAAFYQQRSQAVASIQHQRCQAWANAQRQKCQEMMQAATLVVAWYIRDRISRRRQKDKRRFRAGLRQQSSRIQKAPKGELVRRWVLDVPDLTVPPETPLDRKLADEEEVQFSMDAERTPAKDSKLFEMADRLIRSQHRKVEVPLFGALDLEDSDDDSEDEDEADVVDGDENENVGDVEADDEHADDGDGDEDLLEDDDEMYEDVDEEQLNSEMVYDGTGRGSRRNVTSIMGS